MSSKTPDIMVLETSGYLHNLEANFRLYKPCNNQENTK